MRRIKSRETFNSLPIAKIADVFKPAAVLRRIGRYGKECNEDIEHRGAKNRYHQDTMPSALLKGDFLR